MLDLKIPRAVDPNGLTEDQIAKTLLAYGFRCIEHEYPTKRYARGLATQMQFVTVEVNHEGDEEISIEVEGAWFYHDGHTLFMSVL